jgi:hypothetical protein
MFGKLSQISDDKSVFLCHSALDKGKVRMVNDDLRHFGVKTWLDENNIKVGDSTVGKISDGLKSSQFMVVFLSLWARREWQSFLARQLKGNLITILPVLLDDCEIPDIISDLKYADFRTNYQDGFKQLHASLL